MHLDAPTATLCCCSDDGDPTTRPPLLVTATVEEISLRSSQLSLDEEMRMSGRVVWTGKSSIDIRMELEQVRPGSMVLQLDQLLVTVQGQGHACVHAVASFSSFHSLLNLNRASILRKSSSGRRFLI